MHKTIRSNRLRRNPMGEPWRSHRARPAHTNLLRWLMNIAGFALLTAMAAQVSWRPPGAMHSFSLAMPAVLLCGAFCEKRAALFSQLLYLVLLAAGVPLDSGFVGGIYLLGGIAGGYLIAYPLMAVLVSLLGERRRWHGPLLAGGMLLAAAVHLAFGWAQMMLVSEMSPGSAFAMAVKPFWPSSLACVLGAWAVIAAWAIFVPKRRKARLTSAGRGYILSRYGMDGKNSR